MAHCYISKKNSNIVISIIGVGHGWEVTVLHFLSGDKIAIMNGYVLVYFFKSNPLIREKHI